MTDGEDAECLLTEVARGPKGPMLKQLIDEVTVQETYFLRETRELHAVDWGQLRYAAAMRGSEVRVWISACATGEEAYSIAILASEALGPAPPVSILATDISDTALLLAAQARYSARSVRNVPAEMRKRYFVLDQGAHAVDESIKSLVKVRSHNLVGSPGPPPGEVPFDLILCRNVLIYFDPPTVERVVSSLESALNPDGALILGAADRLTGTTGRLDRLQIGDADGAVDRRGPRPGRRLRRPLGLEPPTNGMPRRRAEDRVEDALIAADAGDLDRAIELTGAVLAGDPLMAGAHFVRGLARLGLDDLEAAVRSFRRALYVDPSFGLAAFQLGRAQDQRGDEKAARRAYEQALRTLDPDDERHRVLLEQVDVGDVAAACAVRLGRSSAKV